MMLFPREVTTYLLEAEHVGDYLPRRQGPFQLVVTDCVGRDPADVQRNVDHVLAPVLVHAVGDGARDRGERRVSNRRAAERQRCLADCVCNHRSSLRT